MCSHRITWACACVWCAFLFTLRTQNGHTAAAFAQSAGVKRLLTEASTRSYKLQEVRGRAGAVDAVTTRRRVTQWLKSLSLERYFERFMKEHVTLDMVHLLVKVCVHACVRACVRLCMRAPVALSRDTTDSTTHSSAWAYSTSAIACVC
jgi:hypothetical protein